MVTLIGVGAIGHQVALQLSAMGVENLALVDYDTVEEHNVVAQAYKRTQIGHSKVLATANDCMKLGMAPGQVVFPIHLEFMTTDSHLLTPVVFCCVDSMKARSDIWSAMTSLQASPDAPWGTGFFCDARMSGETIRILTVTEPEHMDYYGGALFSDEDAYRGTCTKQMTIFHANIAAGLMIQQLSLWMREMPLHPDVLHGLGSYEITRLEPGDGEEEEDAA